MKVFLFTCLLAVALAKHKMEQLSSSEESINISQEMLKQEKDMAMLPTEETTMNIPQMVAAEVPTTESAVFPQEQYQQKMDMAMHATQKMMMTEEEQNFQNYLNIINQYRKITWPQYQEVLQQLQNTMDPWALYQHMPTVV
uniref:Alpha-S2-casein n=1 Tax=Jaculus jaculus TaxID=51337 RepID=A0A8C5L8M2_JACJA